MSIPIVKIANLSKTYRATGHLFNCTRSENAVLKDVSLSIDRGEIFALIGESGSGKTTLGKCLLKFEHPDRGRIYYSGEEISRCKQGEFRPFRRKMQMIFQNPFQALNPKQTVLAALTEVLKIFEKTSEVAINNRIADLLDLVGLDDTSLNKYPAELSGGQQQRVVIARTLAVNPEFIVADEPTSSLDALYKWQIINIFKEIRKNLDLTILLISHDLKLVSHIADRIAVLYAGEIVEQNSAEELYRAPLHPYTRVLMNSAEFRTYAMKDPFSFSSIPGKFTGCSFYHRCPVRKAVCFSGKPELIKMNSGQMVRCFVAADGLVDELNEISKTVPMSC